MPSRLPLARSLKLRLSLLVTALVAAVLLVFLVAFNRSMTASMRRTGGERALAVSTQIATALSQNTTRGLADLRRLGTDSVLLAYLSAPTDAAGTQLQERLRPLAAAGQPPVVLLDSAGKRLLRIASDSSGTGAADGVPLASGRPKHIGIGMLHTSGPGTYADVVVRIGDPDADESSPAGSGFVVIRRVIQTGPNRELLRRLVGAGAVVAVGNRTGGVWTDMTRQIPAPPADTTLSGLVQFTNAAGEPRVGGIAVIDGTPWAVWVDFPEALVLAPARIFLGQMLVLAFGCVILAAVAVAVLSTHIVRPLNELTVASEAIAAGEYSSHVKTDRRDEVGRLATAFNTMVDRVAEARRELEDRVQRRTARLEETRGLLEARVDELQEMRGDLESRAGELQALNQELETFSYSVSHDLRAPLRHVKGFITLVLGSAHDKLNAEERRHLDATADAASRMDRLIDDLLAFSRNGRRPIEKRHVRLDDLVATARQELAADPQSARASWTIAPLPDVEGDAAMLHLVIVNLIGNALKYTRHAAAPHIEIGVDHSRSDQVVVFVKDNGAGFDMNYADKLFGVFQRLHTDEEFEGTGIGLANVRRIVHRHGGSTWAEGVVNSGATFYFSLPRA